MSNELESRKSKGGTLIKYSEGMTNEELAAFLKQEDELDRAYAESAEFRALRAEEARDAEELETEMDLYRYWQP